MQPTLQPTSLTTPPDQLRANFLKIACRENPDPLWHYELAVHKSTRRAPPMTAVPQPAGPTVSLALFNRPDPPCDLEIYGTYLAAEVDPADWLDLWLESQPFTILSRLRVPTIAGALGDIVVSWETPATGTEAATSFTGRLVALKAGPRLALLWFRSAAADYPALAESFFLTISTFRFLDDSPGPLAEQIRWAQAPLPLPWRTAVPTSWEITTEPATPRAASFQATLRAATSPTILGKLTFAVIAPAAAGGPQNADDVFTQIQATLRDAGISAPLAAQELPAISPALQSWQATATGIVANNPAEFHARVLKLPQAWVAGLIVSPPRTASPGIWMRNKRTLDIAMDTVQFNQSEAKP